MTNKKILLIISGGIAAYKSLELIRLLKKSGASVKCILTKGGAEFVTPLSISALCEHEVFTDLWSLKDETEMGHIRLTRESDLIVISPATANLIAKTTCGLADDLASTTLLATDDKTPILFCPAMNNAMWDNPATQDNINTLISRGIHVLPPEEGLMACGETGIGRLPDPEIIYNKIKTLLSHNQDLAGKTAIVTAGPTFEPIDPVRFIGNRSSGKQGYAIAANLASRGASVTLISGPSSLKPPSNTNTIQIETAKEMYDTALNTLPADIAICTAAVSDWSPETQSNQKLKKQNAGSPPQLTLKENPDILKTISNHKNRPKIVIGFAAETENEISNAQDKLQRKGCDALLVNSVAQGKIFAEDQTNLTLITSKNSPENWGKQTKKNAAEKLVDFIAKSPLLK